MVMYKLVSIVALGFVLCLAGCAAPSSKDAGKGKATGTTTAPKEGCKCSGDKKRADCKCSEKEKAACKCDGKPGTRDGCKCKEGVEAAKKAGTEKPAEK